MNSSLGLRVFNATNGSLVANISSGTNYLAVAWDNVGNLYAVANVLKRWRVFSPPGGTNRATTTALETVTVNTAQTPLITSITLSNGVVVILFTGSATDTPAAFSLRNASLLTGPYWDADGAVITQDSPGHFRATVPVSLAVAFYRILRHGSPTPPPPQITDISASGGIVTINFTGQPGDSPPSFLTLSAPAVGGPYDIAANATMITITPGVFRVTLPETGVAQFYKIVRP
jgi:hypothetical protein